MTYMNTWNVRHSFSRYGIEPIKVRKFRGLYWPMVGLLDTEKGTFYELR